MQTTSLLIERSGPAVIAPTGDAVSGGSSVYIRTCRDGHTRSGCHSTTQSQQSAGLPQILGPMAEHGRASGHAGPRAVPQSRPTTRAPNLGSGLGDGSVGTRPSPPSIQYEGGGGEGVSHRCVAALREADVVVGQLRSSAVIDHLRHCGRRSASRRRVVLRRVLDPVKASHVSRRATYADYLPLMPTYS